LHLSFSLLASLIAAASAAAPFGAQATQRVSVSSTGVQSNGHSLGPGAIAASGLFVAFTSNASNLVAGDTNNSADAFVHDRYGSRRVYCTSGTNAGGCAASIVASAQSDLAHLSCYPWILRASRRFREVVATKPTSQRGRMARGVSAPWPMRPLAAA